MIDCSKEVVYIPWCLRASDGTRTGKSRSHTVNKPHAHTDPSTHNRKQMHSVGGGIHRYVPVQLDNSPHQSIPHLYHTFSRTIASAPVAMIHTYLMVRVLFLSTTRITPMGNYSSFSPLCMLRDYLLCKVRSGSVLCAVCLCRHTLTKEPLFFSSTSPSWLLQK